MPFHNYTYYQVLGVQPAVSNAELKRAYRRLVKNLHPDIKHKEHDAGERKEANKRMAKLNEAYETLKDHKLRTAYDISIGLNPKGSTKVQLSVENSEHLREEYLKQIFLPIQQKLHRILGRYKKELLRLSQDIYDEALVEDFAEYSNEIEVVLHKASHNMSKHPAPSSLSAAELMMRHAIAQAADGLEEIKHFCGNYDYNHLAMATNLFRESNDLSKQALYLTRNC